MPLPQKLIIGSDHAGFRLKGAVIAHLEAQGVDVHDVGTYSDEAVDYPDFVHPVADAIEKGDYALGIVVCGTGQGASMTANKHQSIRCALCWKPEIARLAREHNDANILSLAERFSTTEEGLAIVDAFFEAEFEGGRHARRIGKMSCS